MYGGGCPRNVVGNTRSDTVDFFQEITYNCYIMSSNKLTEKMESFCQEYVANGFNGLKAYAKAYSQKSKDISSSEAHKLLQDQRILDRIRQIQGSYELTGLKLGIDRKLIMKKILGLLETKKPIYFQGQYVGEYEDATAVNNAIVTYAKLTGGFEPERKVVTIEEQNEVDVAKLSDDEKKELKARLLKEL